MGLDITAYSHLESVGNHTENWCDDDDHVYVFAYDSFPQSFRGIPVLGTDSTGHEAFLVGGCYARTDQTATHQFRAGSYGGYNQWRADLQAQFNPDRDPEKPFYELIWFADNEGAIGPEAARDLLADFREYAAAYRPALEWIEYAHQSYGDWTRAFELAADGGVVDFH